jgi:hypothetical protein
MTKKQKHFFYWSIIIILAIFFNILPTFSGAPLSKQLSTDAEYHLVHWFTYSQEYQGSFDSGDQSSIDVRPRGELFGDKLLVKTSELLGLGIEDLSQFSIGISWFALLLFLTMVYILGCLVFDEPFWAFILGLGSIIPTFAMGGATWGFLSLGFLPRELALGWCLGLLALFIFGRKHQKEKLVLLTFFLSGLSANWYPVLFFHFIIVLILADVIWKKKVSISHLLYGLLFALGGSFAIYDVLMKAQSTQSLDFGVYHYRYAYMMFSPIGYGIFHYGRRMILYLLWVPLIIWLAKFLKKDIDLSLWRSLFISSTAITIIGIGLEQSTNYARFLFSRASLFFILSSMVISVLVIPKFFEKTKHQKLISGLILLIIFFGQSAIPTIYRSFVNNKNSIDNYWIQKQNGFIEALDIIKKNTLPSEMVLANPSYSNKIRYLIIRPVYSSWKDGGVSLLDGKAAKEWFDRYTETNKILADGNLSEIIKFGQAKKVSVILIGPEKIKSNAESIDGFTSYQAGDYTVIFLKK